MNLKSCRNRRSEKTPVCCPLHRKCDCVCVLCRDWTDQVRIKKTVDAWIDTLTKDIQVSSQQGSSWTTWNSGFVCQRSQFFSSSCPQADLSTEDGVTECSLRKHNTVTSQKRTSGSSTHTGRGQSVSMLRGTGSKAGRGRTAGQRPVGVDAIN